jgi:restriction endonuclease S subunit
MRIWPRNVRDYLLNTVVRQIVKLVVIDDHIGIMLLLFCFVFFVNNKAFLLHFYDNIYFKMYLN